MKIVFLNRFFYPDHSATSRILTDLAFDLAKNFPQVWVVTSRQRYDDPAANLSPREVVKNVTICRMPATRFGRSHLWGRAWDYLTFYISTFFFLLRSVSRNDILIAKTDPPLIGVVAMIAGRIKGAKLVNWVQDLFPEVAEKLEIRGLQGRASRVLKKLRNESFHSARLNVVIGELMAKRVVQQGIPGSRVRVIPNWSDGKWIRPVSPGNNALRRAWGLEGKFVVGYSGNLGRAHEFVTLLDAADLLKQENRFVFLFIGDGQKKPWVEEEVRKRGLSNFLFKSYQPYDRLSDALSVPDAHWVSLKEDLEGLVVPSKFYGIAAAGRPILYGGDPRGEIGGLLLKENCGEVVRAGEGQKLAARIREWADNPSLLKQMGERARLFFEQHLDQPIRLKAWRETLREVVA